MKVGMSLAAGVGSEDERGEDERGDSSDLEKFN